MTVHTVFVYGTLRKGQPNRAVMEPHLVADLGEGQIRGAMYDLGPFPAVTLEEDGLVIGEWVRVTDDGLARLDRLEGYPSFYDRVIVSDTTNGLRGWVYCMARRKVDGYERVESGDWVKRLEQKTVCLLT